jgi:hypothetical protein
MRLVTFVILDVIGSLLYAGLLAGLGYALGHHAVVVAQEISHYGLWVSIGLVVIIMFFQIRSQRHMMRTAQEARANQADADQPRTSEPSASQPSASQPSASQPSTSEPSAQQTGTGEEPGS